MTFHQLIFLVFFVMVMKESYGCHDGPLGMQNGEIKDSQITASSYYAKIYGPSNARLHNAHIAGVNGGGWSTGSSSGHHWVQIDLGSVRKVTGIATQGLPHRNQWIKRYQVLYGNDPNSALTLYYNGKIFTGNTDRNSVVKNIFNPLIKARYIRVLMNSWQSWPAMRMELYGCAKECKAPLGMESKAIKDSQITASSHYGSQYVPSNARFNMKSVQGENGGAWAAGTSTGAQWVQIDLGSNKKITAIATQGHPDKNQWIKTYQILSQKDGESSATLYDNGKVFTGNTDSNSVVKNIFNPPIVARYIKVLVKSWQWWLAMRFELYGCAAE